MPDSDLEHRTDIARLLNRGGLSAAPLIRLAAISIFDDEEYENYDLDMISPRRRRRLSAVLAEAGFRQTSGKVFAAPEGGDPAVLPHPGILGTDPSRPVLDLLSRAGAVVLVTPTQALLAYLHRFAGEPPAALAEELNGLVWEQPANLDKVGQWARAAGRQRTFQELFPGLERAQAEGIELRRRRRFRSRLPN